MTGPAAQPDQDAGLLRGTVAESSFAIEACRDRSRATQSQGAHPAGPQKPAARYEGGLLPFIARRNAHIGVPGSRVVVVANQTVVDRAPTPRSNLSRPSRLSISLEPQS